MRLPALRGWRLPCACLWLCIGHAASKGTGGFLYGSKSILQQIRGVVVDTQPPLSKPAKNFASTSPDSKPVSTGSTAPTVAILAQRQQGLGEPSRRNILLIGGRWPGLDDHNSWA